MKRIASIIIAALLLCACEHEHGFDKTQLTDPTVCLSVRKSSIFQYEPVTCQMVFDKNARSFTAGTDTMSDYFTLSLRTLPSKSGQIIIGDVSWTTADNVSEYRDLSFDVVQLDGNGTAWLWNARQDIAVVISLLN